MPTALIQANVLSLTLTNHLTLTMSLQRHHYRFCAAADALQLNSLFYASVTDQQLTSEAVEVGTQMDKILGKVKDVTKLYGKEFQCKSGRAYLVDNSALNPTAGLNHFFVIKGPSVWDKMSQAEYIAACAIRRVEDAINAQSAASRSNFLDSRKVREKAAEVGGNHNPVVAAYFALRTALLPVPATKDSKLGEVSGRQDIVKTVRDL